jgi:hypothetical protein
MRELFPPVRTTAVRGRGSEVEGRVLIEKSDGKKLNSQG